MGNTSVNGKTGNLTAADAGLGLAATSVKTAPYTAVVGELVLANPTGRTLIDATANTGAPTALTSSSGEFLPTDNGAQINGSFIPAGTTVTYNSPTSMTLSAGVTGTVAAANALRRVDLDANATVTLPSGAQAGDQVVVKNVGWGRGRVRVLPSGSDTIEGATSLSWDGYNVARSFVKDSGTSWNLAGISFPRTGPSSNKYINGLDFYLPNANTLRNARTTLAAAREFPTQQGPFRYLMDGDSTRLGVVGGGGNFAQGVYNPNSLVALRYINATDRLRKKLNLVQVLGGRADTVYSGPSWDIGTVATPISGSRFVLGGATTSSALMSAHTDTITLTDEQPATGWVLQVMRTTSTVPSGVTFAVDGGSDTAIDTSGVTVTQNTYNITIGAVTAGAHSLLLKGPTAGTLQIVAITPINTTTPAVMQIRNSGVSGQLLSQKVAAGAFSAGGVSYPMAQWAPHLVNVRIGVNDMHSWTAVNGTPAQGAAAYKANLITYVNTYKAIGADIILEVFASFGYAEATQPAKPGGYEAYLYHQAIYEVAEQLDCAVHDVQRRVGYGYIGMDYVSQKYPYYDGVHQTLVGYEEDACAEFNLLSLLAA